jgi:hypothetical protein
MCSRAGGGASAAVNKEVEGFPEREDRIRGMQLRWEAAGEVVLDEWVVVERMIEEAEGSTLGAMV